jgi:hypothetical protein
MSITRGVTTPFILNTFTMHLLLAHLTFVLQLHTGIIIPTDDVDGRPIYSVPTAGIEYAYKAEIIDYIQTGVFTYDETLKDTVK